MSTSRIVNGNKLCADSIIAIKIKDHFSNFPNNSNFLTSFIIFILLATNNLITSPTP